MFGNLFFGNYMIFDGGIVMFCIFMFDFYIEDIFGYFGFLEVVKDLWFVIGCEFMVNWVDVSGLIVVVIGKKLFVYWCEYFKMMCVQWLIFQLFLDLVGDEQVFVNDMIIEVEVLDGG